MKKLIHISVFPCLILFSIPSSPSGEESKVLANFQIQGTESLHDMFDDGTNVDNSWGRLNFGASSTAESFSGKLNLRMYPVGFGYEVLSGIDTATGIASTTSIEKIQIEKAFVNYKKGAFSIKLGRYYTSLSHTLNMGDYLIKDPGIGFISRLYYHNAMELGHHQGVSSLSVLLGTMDRHFNKGYIRIVEKVELSEYFNISFGYRSNVISSIQNDIDIVNHFTVPFEIKPGSDWIFFGELGFRNTFKSEYNIPVHMGFAIPVPKKFLDQLIFEGEYYDKRANDADPLLFGFAASKWISSRTRFQISLYSLQEMIKPTFGLRFTGVIM